MRELVGLVYCLVWFLMWYCWLWYSIWLCLYVYVCILLRGAGGRCVYCEFGVVWGWRFYWLWFGLLGLALWLIVGVFVDLWILIRCFIGLMFGVYCACCGYGCYYVVFAV